jgi:hypothetical protein
MSLQLSSRDFQVSCQPARQRFKAPKKDLRDAGGGSSKITLKIRLKDSGGHEIFSTPCQAKGVFLNNKLRFPRDSADCLDAKSLDSRLGFSTRFPL